MKKHVDTTAIAQIGTLPGLVAAAALGAIMLALNFPPGSALGMSASLFLFPAVSSMLESCRLSYLKLHDRSDFRQIWQRSLTYFSIGFLLFGALQVRLAVLPSLTQPFGTLLLPSAVLFSVVQALFMGLLGAKKILASATRASSA